MAAELRYVDIFPAMEADLDAIAVLEAEAFPTPWRRELFTGELGAPGRYGRVARNDQGALVGYLFAMYLFDEMHVNKIAVAEAYRRRGIARQLMDDCIAFARSQDVKWISLEVRQSNSGAQKFYDTLEFRPVYLRRGYYPDGESAIVMTAQIG
jgi:ribosomal-protein-alanine acetyltransferase